MTIKIPALVLAASALFAGIAMPHHAASAEEPADVEDDAEAWCDQLAAEGYDTTGCVDTYVGAYNGDVDLGPNSSSYFDDPGGEIQLPCTESVEYQAYLDDPLALPDPCATPPAEPDPCTPIPGGPGGLEPDPCPAPPPVLAPPAQPQKLTWKGSFTTKLYIAGFPLNKCGTPTFVKLTGPKQIAKYAAFCLATAQSYKENPPKGDNNVNPLDARIWAKADLVIVCAPNKAVPDSGSIDVGGTAAGKEVGPFGGVVETPRRRDQIAANGEYGFVTWGRPNAALEPGFILAGGPRAQRHIWNKVTGTATCKTGNDGKPSVSLTYKPDGTGFPSHKIWWNGKLAATIPQGTMSVLWELPPVPQA
jgi:hypothetical protein